MKQIYDKTIAGTSMTAAAKAQALARAQALALAQAKAKALADAKVKALQKVVTKPVVKPTVATKPTTANISVPKAVTTAIPVTDPALAALNASKAAQVRAQDLSWQEALRLANEQKTNTSAQAEQLAQEAYVSKMQQERVLPNVMAQAGLQGQGYTETTANNIGTSYQNAWNAVQKNKANALSAVDSSLMAEQSKINQNKASIDAQYQTDLANYNASLAKSLSSGTTTKSGKQKAAPKAPASKNPFVHADVKKDPFGAVKDALASFAWEPRDPQGSRVAMENYLQVFVTNKLMTATQLKDYINQFMAGYYNRETPGGTYTMNETTRRASS